VTRYARRSELCHICTHADAEGSWHDLIPGLTHCRGCHATWGMRTEFQHCVMCHHTFTNWRAAKAHRGPEGCRHPATVKDGKGRNRLALSTRALAAGSTVTLWATADHRPNVNGTPQDRHATAAPAAPTGAVPLAP
jgi:hypothetical protein